MKLIWADCGYAGELVAWGAETLNLELSIVIRSDARKDSTSCTDAGSSNAPWSGSHGTADASATTNDYQPTTKPWSAGS